MLVISAALLAAFLWGYKGEELSGIFGALFKKSVDESLATSQPKTVLPNYKPPKTSIAKPAAKAPVTSGAVARGDSGATRAPAQPQPGSLAGTLDAITPGSIQDEQQARRNLYFERLSTQLKEIQAPAETGEQPPSAEPGAENSAEANGALPPDEATAETEPVPPQGQPAAPTDDLTEDLSDLLAE